MKRKDYLKMVLAQIEASALAGDWMSVREMVVTYQVPVPAVKGLLRKFARTEEGHAMANRIVFAEADNAGGRKMVYEHGIAKTVAELLDCSLREAKARLAWTLRDRNRWAAVAKTETNPVSKGLAVAIVDILDKDMADQRAMVSMLLEQVTRQDELVTNGS